MYSDVVFLYLYLSRSLCLLGPKWIVLDGDIDPMWIESLNTVMDDNKVLTLASNERIPLNPTMRLLFEISHLRTATPATVSRAGILYINPADLGWNPQVATWIETREIQSERANLTILFDKYVPMCLEAVKSRFKKITPIVEGAHIHMLCRLLECMLTPTNTPADCPKELYEVYFVFACVWAFGSALFQDQLTDHRLEFSKWWITEFKSVKFPAQGTVFDYYIDNDTKKFEPWTKLVPKFRLDGEMPLQVSCFQRKKDDFYYKRLSLFSLFWYPLLKQHVFDTSWIYCLRKGGRLCWVRFRNLSNEFDYFCFQLATLVAVKRY